MPSSDKPPAPPAPEPAAAPESDLAPRTAWHPMLVALLERYLPEGYQLIAEFLLARQSQRVDIVVIRKVDAQGPVRKLHSILDYLRADGTAALCVFAGLPEQPCGPAADGRRGANRVHLATPASG